MLGIKCTVTVIPVRAKLVEQVQDWQWSSVKAHLAGSDDGLVKVGPVLERYGEFQNFLGEGDCSGEAYRQLRQSETTGRPLGDDAWIEQIEAQSGRSLKPKKRGPKKRRLSVNNLCI